MSKPNRFEDNYRNTIAPRGGLIGEGNNLTRISRTRGKMGFSCGFCGLPIECMATKSVKADTHYCSRSCLGKARSIAGRSKVNCLVCGGEFLKKKSRIEKDRGSNFCSKKCSQEKYRCKAWLELRNRNRFIGCGSRVWIENRRSVIDAASKCFGCGSDEIEKVVVTSNNRVFCRDCHLSLIAPLGPLVRDVKKSQKAKNV